MTTLAVPKAFIWRRLHSLMGLWLVLFLCEHLLTNSQAALWLGDNGKGFVDMVNAIHNFPYLEVIEVVLLGVPLLLHMIWGVKYLMTSKFNVAKGDGSAPHMPLPRNRAYTWQRITSWILLVGIILHVAKFRFIDYPETARQGGSVVYLNQISVDNGLYTVADRLGVKLYNQDKIAKEIDLMNARSAEQSLVDAAQNLSKEPIHLSGPQEDEYNAQKSILFTSAQNYQEQLKWVRTLEKQQIPPGHVLAVSPDFGTASLLAVRNTFKNPIYGVFYTVFVLAACFHAANGFWTFLLSWGWILKRAAQRAWVTVSVLLMAALIFLGIAAIWGTYWLNLRY